MKKQRFFTLIELLATIGIVMILAGITLGGLRYAAQKGDIAKTRSAIEQLNNALEAFHMNNGYYPVAETECDVQFLTDGDGKFKLKLGDDKYVFENSAGKAYLQFQADSTASDYTDSWGQALKYKCPGSHNPQKYDLYSDGPDTDKEDDDICNW